MWVFLCTTHISLTGIEILAHTDTRIHKCARAHLPIQKHLVFNKTGQSTDITTQLLGVVPLKFSILIC